MPVTSLNHFSSVSSRSSHVAEENYLVSLSDLIIGLLFVFIIILMGFALNYRHAEQKTQQETQAQQQTRVLLLQEKQHLEQVVSRLTNNDTVRRGLLRDIQSMLKQQGLQVLIDEKNGILRLPETLLFASGEAQLQAAGEQAIQHLGQALKVILPCYSIAPDNLQQHCATMPLDSDLHQARLEAVLIEGHTDDRPIHTPDFKDNWALASARALNTWKALIQVVPALDSLKNPQQQALLSVSAYASRRPVAPQDSAENRRKNRRIDLRFLMATPAPELIQRLSEKLPDRE